MAKFKVNLYKTDTREVVDHFTIPADDEYEAVRIGEENWNPWVLSKSHYVGAYAIDDLERVG